MHVLGDYRCQECNGPATAHQGVVKVAHSAIGCQFHQGLKRRHPRLFAG